MQWQTLSGEQLFAALPDPAIIFSADGTVMAANQSAAELFERDMPFPALTVTELLAQPERKRLDPLTWMRKWADSPHAPELQYVYLTCRTASGVEKQLSVRVARVQLDAEVCYLVTMHDVSRWEARLREERDAHRIAARVLAISADAVLMVDEQTNVTYVNDSTNRLLGYAPGELLGQPLAKLIPERFRGQHDAFMAAFAREPVPSRLMGERSPIVALAKDGEEILVEASISRITSKGKPVFSAQLRDLRTRGGHA